MTLDPTLRAWRLAYHLRDQHQKLTDHIPLLRDCYRAQAQAHRIRTLAMVVLPFSVHGVWLLPSEVQPQEQWKGLLQAMQRHMAVPLRLHTPWIAPVSAGDIAWAVDDIHAQPVKWKLAARAEEWPYSSAHRALETV